MEECKVLKLAEGLRVVDADSHVTERHALFTERAPKGFVDRVSLRPASQRTIVGENAAKLSRLSLAGA
jgi:hypothetical protein